MRIPQFPNVFYGSAKINGEPAPVGSIVTAVVLSEPDFTERRFTLEVKSKGKFGSGNGLKLKVGGSGDDIYHRARIAFYVSLEELGDTIFQDEAGHSHFYDDQNPHITLDERLEGFLFVLL